MSVITRSQLLSMFSLALVSCGGENRSGSDSEPAPALKITEKPGSVGKKTMTLYFEGRADSVRYSCEKSLALGSKNTPYRILDFRFFVSEIELTNSRGQRIQADPVPQPPWQNETVALIALGTKAEGPEFQCGGPETLRNQITVEVPEDSYTALSFTIGVPEKRNHISIQDENSAVPPLNVQQMYWNWKGGYRFLKLDGKPETGDGMLSFHLGSSGCGEGDIAATPASPCTVPNRPRVDLRQFDPDINAIAVDIAPLFSKLDLSDPAVCMGFSGSVCRSILPWLGLTPEGQAVAAEQRVFTAVKKDSLKK